MSNSSIYTVGGTVQAGDGIYITRRADEELLALCRRSVFTYVLTSRQMGKSSLMVRTAERLGEEGIQSVVIDLTQLGVQLTAEQWYLGLLSIIEETLALDTDVVEWWQKREHLGFTQRLTQFFQRVLLVEVTSPVVIFVDEIDTTLSLDFTDDFFAAIRYLYNARSQMSDLQRLSFVLIGVATPGDLIRDPKRTPFNIGQRLDLTDFNWSEALPLADGLGLPKNEAEQILRWVLEWTGGHPYLTQRLCCAITEENQSNWSKAKLELVVSSTFFGVMSQQDNNLQFVRDMLTKRAPDLFGVLTTYREIYQGKRPVKDEEQSLIKSHLKLSGVVCSERNLLRVRNRIYRKIFDNRWIKENLPVPSKILTLQTVFLICTSVAAVILGIRELGWLQRWELRAYDQMMLSRPSEPPDERILLVTVTEEDVLRYGKPLSDKTVNQLLKKIQSYQPRVIGLNIYRPQQTNLAAGLNKDNIFAICAFESMGQPELPPPPNFSKDNIAFSDLIPDNKLDNVVRRALIFATSSQNSSCYTDYSFASRLALYYLKYDFYDFNFTKYTIFYIEKDTDKIFFPTLKTNSGGYINIDDGGYQILINYRNHRNVARTVTLTQVLTDKVNPNLIKDRLVIIGNSGRTLDLVVRTPYSTSSKQPSRIPTVFIHAQITSQIISTVLDGRPFISYLPEWAEALWVWGWSIIGGVLVWKLGYKWQTYLVVGISISVLVGICYIWILQALWVPVVPPATALIISCLSVGSISYLILIRINRK